MLLESVLPTKICERWDRTSNDNGILDSLWTLSPDDSVQGFRGYKVTTMSISNDGSLVVKVLIFTN